jgi:glycerol-3-phosphate dehydrogenase
VLGAGNFGTCLAQHLANNLHDVTIWSIEEDVVASINHKRQNLKYLSSAILSERIAATNKISRSLLETSAAIVIALPTQALRAVLEGIKADYNPDLLLVSTVKGIEIDTLALPLGIIQDVLGADIAHRACVLSGPSFAEEVFHRQPTAVSMASFSEADCLAAQDLFHAPFFRVYRSSDPIGLGVAGAVKNVIAIAAGAVAGLGFQNNSRAALLTRGLAEISKIGIAMGADSRTFNGLGGVGDLFLTCTSEKSRNFTVGFRLGKGEMLEDILKSVGSVAEGVYTAKAVHILSRKLGVEAPICDQVYEVLYENKAIQQAVSSLLTREPKAEF